MLKVEIYIPKEPVHPYIRLRDTLIAQFDGMTEAPMCIGIWRGASGTLDQEGVSVITILVHDTHPTEVPKSDKTPSIEKIHRLLRRYKIEAKQEAVLYTVSPIKMYLL